MNDIQTVDRYAQVIWGYMKMDQPLQKCGAILVLGSSDVRVAERGADLFLAGYGDCLIFSGGYGGITKTKRTEPEAERFADVARKKGVPTDRVITETESSNTGENIRFTWRLLQSKALRFDSLLLIQKPYMERRTYAAFKKQWPDPATEIVVTSPQLSYENYLNEYYDRDHVVNVMVGDLLRIKEYPKLGYQIGQEIPDEVWHAYEALVALGYDKRTTLD